MKKIKFSRKYIGYKKSKFFISICGYSLKISFSDTNTKFKTNKFLLILSIKIICNNVRYKVDSLRA